MKKLSIKARVTLWYTGLLALLLALAGAYLLSVSGQLSSRQLRERLFNCVSDAVKATGFSYGELEDEDVDFYRDGVSIFLYDTGGHLLAPKVTRGIQLDAILEDGAVKTVESAGEKWMVHDVYAKQDGVNFWVRGAVSLSGTQGTLRRLFLLALVGVPVFLLAAVLGGWELTKRAFAPVGSMARTADAITTGKDLSLRVPDDGSGDELSLLASTVNRMLERLQSSFENETQFTSDVSHELRTPAAVILSQCEYALSEGAGEADRREALEAVLRQAKRISSIISQLLLLARAENGRFSPTWETVDLGQLCQLTAEEFSDRAKEAGITLCKNILPVTMTGDETLLLRLLNNLMANALQYNRPGGTVTVELKPRGDSCLLTVSDTGVGIRPEDREKIWNRFYRASSSRSGGGSGLGLSMVKWITEAHGGQIRVESEYGAGTRFLVTLPLERRGEG